MDFYAALVAQAHPVAVEPSKTSYFSAPGAGLDPRLIRSGKLVPAVRSSIMRILFEHMQRHYKNPESYTHIWLAGSGVSYQWEASRLPGDLDCLVGINYVKFRESNQEYAGFSDAEIAANFNEGFNAELMPKTRNWEGYELTYYVNQQSDIRDINPYAAYDLTLDEWTVKPDTNPQPPYSRAWEQNVQRDSEMAEEMINRYHNALDEARKSNNLAHKLNAERKLQNAVEQAVAFYDDIHTGRKAAFSKTGAGYSDYNNYRWQAGKKSGIVPALRTIKDLKTASDSKEQLKVYGTELPNASTLVRRTLRGK